MAQNLTAGTKVKIIIDPPGGLPAVGVIKILQNTPGKTIGVELEHFTDYAHSLDKQVDERTDPVRDITVGKGWWTKEENIEIIK